MTCSFKPGETIARLEMRDPAWPEQVSTYTARGTSDKFTGERTYDNDRGVHGKGTFTNNDLGRDDTTSNANKSLVERLQNEVTGMAARRGKEAIEECNKRRKPDPNTPMS